MRDTVMTRMKSTSNGESREEGPHGGFRPGHNGNGGEPQAGSVPSRLRELIKPVEDLFCQGLRAETLGFGVGAVAYYRRVLATQSEAIFDAVMDVARKMNTSGAVLKQLEQAKSSFSFDERLNDFAAVMPTMLLIKGHNPFKLLHRAVWEGLHSASDEDAVELASFVRVILMQLAEKIAAALASLEDDAEINRLLARLGG